MLEILEKIFLNGKIETPHKQYIEVHSHTSKDQCIFLQEIFDKIMPEKSLEVGLAFGISALAILEKHREFNNSKGVHLVIEPNDAHWGGVAEFNIEKAGLTEFMDIRYLKSDDILPKLYYENHRIQFAYIDTVKLFDTVLQDFYFIDKILDINGVVIFDDCGGSWPGVQRVARFINSLPHYKILAGHNKVLNPKKKKLRFRILKSILWRLPHKDLYYPTINFQTDEELGLNYRCIAFQKISEDKRNWDWDASF